MKKVGEDRYIIEERIELLRYSTSKEHRIFACHKGLEETETIMMTSTNKSLLLDAFGKNGWYFTLCGKVKEGV